MSALDGPRDRSYMLALGFATAVSMWAVAYIGRLPAVMAPGWVILFLMVFMVALWGRVAGLLTGGGWRAGLAVGGTAAVLNLLILGSLLSPAAGTGVTPSALWWVPGSILIVGLVAALASALSSRQGPAGDADWTAMFSKVAVGATFLLVVAGGLVTSNEAGLAVVDWPNSFGYNMFLYPLSRMTGGIYYEHAHRLFGSLVGLTTVVLAFHLWRVGAPQRVRRMALAAVVLVIVQGLLGGLRVTGHFTLSVDAGVMAPSIALAVLHGVLGQVFLGLMVSLAVVTSRAWKGASPPQERRESGADRSLHIALVSTLVFQLVLGAVQRHLAELIVVHVSLAAVVTVIAVAAGLRAWGLYQGEGPIRRLGRVLMTVVCIQVTLGIAALAVTQGQAVVGNPTTLEVTLATAHQACGAVLLAVAVMLMLWTRRLFTVEENLST